MALLLGDGTSFALFTGLRPGWTDIRKGNVHRMNRIILQAGVVALLGFGLGCNDSQLAPGPVDLPTGGLSGRVCAPNGQSWLADARVSIPIQNEAGSVTMEPETLTDLDGFFTLMGVPVGDWVVQVVKGSFSTDFPVTIVEGEVTVIPEPHCIDPASANVAVVTGAYDKVEQVLARVGIENVTIYDGLLGMEPSISTLLNDPALLEQYDIVFINCGAMEMNMMGPSLVESPTVQANLRNFVESGGSLYASDWAYDYIERTWPYTIEFYGDDNIVDSAAWGIDGLITAQVEDTALASYLGQSTVSLNYDLGSWVVTESAGSGTRVLVTGSAQALDINTYQNVTVPNAPLMVMFEYGEGKVMYTTFHNEAQSTADMDIILEYMVFEL